MVGWHSLRLFQNTQVILNFKLLLNLEVTFSKTSSGMYMITLWSRIFQITGPILKISITVSLTFTHIGDTVPNIPQKVKFLLKSITSQDNALQAAMGNIRSNNNGLRIDSEGASSHLIEVDPYRRSTKYDQTEPNPVKVSAVTFSGRGKTGVDLRWQTWQEFRDISSDQKDKLTSWKGSNKIKYFIKKQRTINSRKRKSDLDNSEKGNWQKNFKQEIETQSELSHIMYIMLKEETKKSSLVAALHPPLLLVPSKTPPLPPPPVPTPVPTIATAAVGTLAAALPDVSTKVQLHSILNLKWKSSIYSSDDNSIEGRNNGSDLHNGHISDLVSSLFNSSDAPMNETKSELDSQ